MLQINENEYAPYYKTYIDAVALNGKSIIQNLNDTLQEALDLLNDLPEEKLLFRYAEGKWTIKELVQHIIDSERVFTYRALRFARKDTTPLPGFEQDDYVAIYDANNRIFMELLEELEITRKATIALFKSFGDAELKRIGNASGSNMSVRALGYIISGHLKHHINIINERYIY